MKEALFIKLHNEKDWLKPLIEPDILQEPVEEPEFSARVSAIYYGRGHEGEAFSGTLEELKSWIQEESLSQILGIFQGSLGKNIPKKLTVIR